MKKKQTRGNGGKRATLIIRRLALAKCAPHPKNPRKHPEPGTPEWSALERSLALDYFDPIVWNKQNGLLVSGHLRCKVLEQMGYTEVDAVVVDYDDITHLARLVAANKQQGANDLPILRDVITEIGESALGLEGLTGWTIPEVEELMKVDISKPLVEGGAKTGQLTTCPHCGGEF